MDIKELYNKDPQLEMEVSNMAYVIVLELPNAGVVPMEEMIRVIIEKAVICGYEVQEQKGVDQTPGKDGIQ